MLSTFVKTAAVCTVYLQTLLNHCANTVCRTMQSSVQKSAVFHVFHCLMD